METLATLEARIGGRAHFSVNGVTKGGTVILMARWPCGCIATGHRFLELTTAFCDQHERQTAPETTEGTQTRVTYLILPINE